MLMVAGTRFRGLVGCFKNAYAPGLLSSYFPGDRIIRPFVYEGLGDSFSSLSLAPNPYPAME